MTYNEYWNGAVALLAALDVPDRMAVEFLGHSSISTTMNIFARVASESKKEATDKRGYVLWETIV